MVALGRKHQIVSVPLRGKYRGEGLGLFMSLLSRWVVVSVPLRGKYRGEAEVLAARQKPISKAFPSPCGVNIVAKMSTLLSVLGFAAQGFRPLAG